MLHREKMNVVAVSICIGTILRSSFADMDVDFNEGCNGLFMDGERGT